MKLFSILEGIGGQPEINRTIGAFGAVAYVVSAIGFEGWNMLEGRPFELVAFCTAFPAGLSAVVLAVGSAVAIKDKGVASARATDAATQAATGATQ